MECGWHTRYAIYCWWNVDDILDMPSTADRGVDNILDMLSTADGDVDDILDMLFTADGV